MIKFFIDFDGTISKNDVIDLILERFAGPEWKKVEAEWISGKIGSRECLTRQIALVNASENELKTLIQEVELDPHFISFLKKAFEYSIPITIVSDGLDWVIRNTLNYHFQSEPGLLLNLPVYSNFLFWKNDKPQISFSTKDVCSHACANCKELVIKTRSEPSDEVVFIGDGLSDRYAAKISNLTFAKGKLLKFCEDNKIIHKKYSNFNDIKNWLEKRTLNITRPPNAEKESHATIH